MTPFIRHMLLCDDVRPETDTRPRSGRPDRSPSLPPPADPSK
jgi:hypothetical protein